MSYELYKKKLSKEGYFSRWSPENYETLTSEMEQILYEKYLVKCEVFSRDKYTCRNEDCDSKTDLTMHHVKFQKNGGRNTVRNCVTICDKCHNRFNAGKQLVFPKSNTLPSHISGHTFIIDPKNFINWKKVRAEMKKLRKTLKEHHGIRLSIEDLRVLMQWLRISVDELE